jgi:hypothetical protein
MTGSTLQGRSLLLVLATTGCAAATRSTPDASRTRTSSPAEPSAAAVCLDAPRIAGLISTLEPKDDDFNTMVEGTSGVISRRAADATATYPLVAAAFSDAARSYDKGEAAWKGRYWEKDLLKAKEMLANGAESFAKVVDLCMNS